MTRTNGYGNMAGQGIGVDGPLVVGLQHPGLPSNVMNKNETAVKRITIDNNLHPYEVQRAEAAEREERNAGAREQPIAY